MIAPTVAGTPPPVAAPARASRQFRLSADALFAFDGIELQAEGRREIARLAAQLEGARYERIEVVGHTDERPIGTRQLSNLDRDLPSVLNSNASVASLTPADNAGLGLARAVAVVSVLRQNPLLDGYKIIPLSGAQLVNTDETLALGGSPDDVQQRRRIEIRLRKSVASDRPSSMVPPPVLPLDIMR